MYSGTCIPGNGDRVAILVMAHTISSGKCSLQPFRILPMCGAATVSPSAGMVSLHQKDGRNVISHKHSAGGVQIFHPGSQSLVLGNGFKKLSSLLQTTVTSTQLSHVLLATACSSS